MLQTRGRTMKVVMEALGDKMDKWKSAMVVCTTNLLVVSHHGLLLLLQGKKLTIFLKLLIQTLGCHMHITKKNNEELSVK